VPAEQIRTFENDFDISSLLGTVGQLVPSPRQIEILFAPVNPDDVLVRPDGQVYLDWQWYAGRLAEAFPVQWALIPQGMPKIKDNLLIWAFWLVIDGHLMGFAIGEQSRANQNMTWAECCEGAKSNALMRLCKGLGMARSLWHKPFIDKWMADYAEQYRDDRDKLRWRRKKPANSGGVESGATGSAYGEALASSESGGNDKPPMPVEAEPATLGGKSPPEKPHIITNWAGKEVVAKEKIGKAIAASAKWATVFIEKFDHSKHYFNHLKAHFGVGAGGDLTWEQAQALHDHLYKSIDDPRWYQVTETDRAMKKSYVDKGFESLYSELHRHVEPKLDKVDREHYLEVMKAILEGVLSGVYTNPPTESELADMKDTLTKELKLND
jgi:hypothetical protein